MINNFLWLGKNKSIFIRILTVNKLRIKYEEKGGGGILIFLNNALMFIQASLNYTLFSHTQNKTGTWKKYRKSEDRAPPL